MTQQERARKALNALMDKGVEHPDWAADWAAFKQAYPVEAAQLEDWAREQEAAHDAAR